MPKAPDGNPRNTNSPDELPPLDDPERSSLDDCERSSLDDIIELYKRDVDRTLLREQLRKTPDERVRELVELERFAEELRKAGRKAFR